ncbi:MAG: hypothetical protein R3F43_13245 [bacterium]
MYWTGDDQGLAELDPDDQRGLRFLYGPAGEGLLCDQCESNDDCAAGGLCLGLEPGRSFCGQPCGAGNACPAHAACFELQGGGTTCAPEARVCSDRGQGQFAAGDYCFGARPVPGQPGVRADPRRRRCTAPGSVAFGAECNSSFESARACLPAPGRRLQRLLGRLQPPPGPPVPTARSASPSTIRI